MICSTCGFINKNGVIWGNKLYPHIFVCEKCVIHPYLFYPFRRLRNDWVLPQNQKLLMEWG